MVEIKFSIFMISSKQKPKLGWHTPFTFLQVIMVLLLSIIKNTSELEN